MYSVRRLMRWSVASNERAAANARAAATECSRQRVERAEVEHILAGMARVAGSTREVTATAR